jgi:transcriptional regulator NrdR family protein
MVLATRDTGDHIWRKRRCCRKQCRQEFITLEVAPQGMKMPTGVDSANRRAQPDEHHHA